MGAGPILFAKNKVFGMEIVIILEIIPIFAVESTAKSDDKE